MNIIKFYLFYIFSKFISSQINITEDEYFYVKKFYIEISDSKFDFKLIQNSASNKLMNLLPLENQQTQIYNESILINLNTNINIDQSIKTFNLNKGNIYTDGSNLIIYYGNSKIIEYESLVLIGNIENIDNLINIIINNKISKVTIKISCENSFIGFEIKNITVSDPTIVLFNKYSYSFFSIPNLYYGTDEPLYQNCVINEVKNYEIICTFSEEEIFDNFLKYKEPVSIFEIIPGCNKKIRSKFYLKFVYNLKCENIKYKVSKNGEKCVFSPYFYYICIGVPIINFFILLFFGIGAYNSTDEKKTFICVILSCVLVLGLFNVLSFIPFYKKIF